MATDGSSSPPARPGRTVVRLVGDGRLFRETVRPPVGLGDYATLAWMASSTAMVGGALGSGFDDEQAVRDAAYGYRQRERRKQQDAEPATEQGQ